MKPKTEEEIQKLAEENSFKEIPDAIESECANYLDFIELRSSITVERSRHSFGFIQGYTEAQSDKERYAQDKAREAVEEYKMEFENKIDELIQELPKMDLSESEEKFCREIYQEIIDLINSKQETKQK